MHPDLEKLTKTGRLSTVAAQTISSMEVGSYVNHRSWGAGKVSEWDLAGDRLLIDFRDKPRHPMKLEFAAKSLLPITENHIFARALIDPDAVRKMAEDDPVATIRLVLESHGRSMSLDQFDEVAMGTLVSKQRFKPWWEAAKKKLRMDRTFVVPSKRTLPLELRDEDISPAQSLIDDFENTRDLKGKANALVAILSDISIFEDAATQLASTIASTNVSVAKGIRIQPAAAMELALARDDIQLQIPELVNSSQPTVPELLVQAGERLTDFLTKLPVVAQRRVLDSYPDAFGEEWVTQILSLLPGAGLRGTTEIARVLEENGKKAELDAHLLRGIQERSLNSDTVAWICKERKGASASVFSGELAPAVLAAVEKDHYDEGPKRSNRLLDAITGDQELLPDLARDSSLPAVKTLARRLLATPAFDELSRRSLLARIIKVFPEIEEVVLGVEKNRGSDVLGGSGKLIVSWESLEKRKEYFNELINVKIPANKKEIQVAREYGDLSENYEYKAAKDEQAKLTAERNMVEADIKRARGTDFAGADTSRVSIGTTFGITDVDSGGEDTYTLLGAWDTDVEQKVLSYLSETAKALIGSKEGDIVELPTAEAGVTRSVKVGTISAFNQKG